MTDTNIRSMQLQVLAERIATDIRDGHTPLARQKAESLYRGLVALEIAEENRPRLMVCEIAVVGKCEAPKCDHMLPHQENRYCHALLTDCRHGVCDCEPVEGGIMRDWIPSYTEKELREAFEEAGKTDDLSSMSLDRKQGRDIIGHYLFHQVHVVRIIKDDYHQMFQFATSGDMVTNLGRAAKLGSSNFRRWEKCDYWVGVTQFVRYAIRQRAVIDSLQVTTYQLQKRKSFAPSDRDAVTGTLATILTAGTAYTKYLEGKAKELVDRAKQALENPEIADDMRRELQGVIDKRDHKGCYPIPDQMIDTIAVNVADVFIKHAEAVTAYYAMGKAFVSIDDAIDVLLQTSQHPLPSDLTQSASQVLAGKAAQDAIKIMKDVHGAS